MRIRPRLWATACLLLAACGGPGAAPEDAVQPGTPPPVIPPPATTFTYFGPATMTVNGAPVAGDVSLVVFGSPEPSATLGFLTTGATAPYSGAGFKFALRSLPSVRSYTLSDALPGTGVTWSIYAPDEYAWDPFATKGTLQVVLTEVRAGAIHGAARFAEKYTLDATF